MKRTTRLNKLLRERLKDSDLPIGVGYMSWTLKRMSEVCKDFDIVVVSDEKQRSGDVYPDSIVEVLLDRDVLNWAVEVDRDLKWEIRRRLNE